MREDEILEKGWYKFLISFVCFDKKVGCFFLVDSELVRVNI